MRSPRLPALVVIGLSLITFPSPRLTGTEPAFRLVKPAAKHPLVVPAWEENSTSPTGDQRFGGDDHRQFVFSPDGKLLVGEDAGGWQLELWEVGTGKSLGKFGRISDPVSLAFAPDGKTLFSAAGATHNEPYSVDRWDVATRKLSRNLDEKVNDTPCTALALSPDGTHLALGSTLGNRKVAALGILLWDATTGDQITAFEGLIKPNTNHIAPRWIYFDSLTFSPDGKTLVYVSERKVMLVEVATGEVRGQLATLPPRYARGQEDGSHNATAASFSPDGRTLAVSCSDGVVRSWDYLTGTELTPLVGHKGEALSVQFARDGKFLWTFGRDHVALTWNVDDLRQPLAPAEELSATTLAELWNDLRCGNSCPRRIRGWHFRPCVPWPCVPKKRCRCWRIACVPGRPARNSTTTRSGSRA